VLGGGGGSRSGGGGRRRPRAGMAAATSRGRRAAVGPGQARRTSASRPRMTARRTRTLGSRLNAAICWASQLAGADRPSGDACSDDQRPGIEPGFSRAVASPNGYTAKLCLRAASPAANAATSSAPSCPLAFASRRGAGVSKPRRPAPAADDEHERRARLLLLSKGAVLAHWLHRPLAAGMDDEEQLGCRTRHERDP
jgi:hypothetical protein